MTVRFSPIARLFGALAVLIGSFWITLKTLDYIDDNKHSATLEITEDRRPTNWKTSGSASYDIRGDAIVMHGPNYIFVENDCKLCIEAEFSISLQRAGIANMQLLFLSPAGTAISEPTVQSISEMEGKVARVRAAAPPGTSKVRALIYSPQTGDVATFTNPIVRIRLKP